MSCRPWPALMPLLGLRIFIGCPLHRLHVCVSAAVHLQSLLCQIGRSFHCLGFIPQPDELFQPVDMGCSSGNCPWLLNATDRTGCRYALRDVNVIVMVFTDLKPRIGPLKLGGSVPRPSIIGRRPLAFCISNSAIRITSIIDYSKAYRISGKNPLQAIQRCRHGVLLGGTGHRMVAGTRLFASHLFSLPIKRPSEVFQERGCQSQHLFTPLCAGDKY
jgi:hypothetical protein